MERYSIKKGITRRTFIGNTATGSLLIAMGPLNNLLLNDLQKDVNWPSFAKEYRFHMIGHAHIDPVWLWPWTEGVSVVHSTFRAALDRMKETPAFTVVASSAQFYQWVADNDPGMLEEIRKRVEEGRWNIVGGWWVEPDVNIPSGEAMVRQGLYGQLTFRKLFGRCATVAFNPDSFGHTQTLPQIIKQQGMENYIFMRPAQHEKSIPADLFWWESADGTRVLTYRIQFSYNDTAPVKQRMERALLQNRNQPMKNLMHYYGAGDHGGGATKENIRSVEESKNEKGAPEIIFSTPERYFREIRSDNTLVLPVVKDDLQHHAVGCYTAESQIKKGNRLSENALVIAEKISAIGAACWNANYPIKDLTDAWKRVLFLQFHDSLAGTSLYEHSITAREGFGHALDTANQAAYLSLQKLEWQVPAEDPASQYLVVFNPHAWEVKGNIEYDFNWGAQNNSSRVEDEKGNPLIHQWTAGSTETGSRRKIIVSALIPPMGYCQLRLLGGEPAEVPQAVKAEVNTIENEYLKVRFSDAGTIGILNKETGRELFSGGVNGCRAIVIDDPSDTWSHDIKSYTNEIGSFGNASFRIIENGPLRAALRVTSSYNNSELSIDWILYAGSRTLEARVTLDWHEHLRMVKFSFPVDIDSPVAAYETPYGHIVRETSGNEDPGQRWIDVTGLQNGIPYGLSVINDAKYGYSISNSDLRISVVRSAVYAHHNPMVLDMQAEHLWMDQGIQTFRMLLVPHRDSWREADIPRLAEEFTGLPLVCYQGIHGGSLSKSASFLKVDPSNVIVSAIKKSEDGNDMIIRCIETSGQHTRALLDLVFAGQKWTGTFRPLEIKTIRYNQKTGDIRETNLIEE